MALSRPPDPRALLREAGLAAKKSWGQNFLCDQTVLAAIAEATGVGPGVPAVELGAGLGALTFHLLQRGGHVVAIERDRELAPVLRRVLGHEATAPSEAGEGSLEVREADAGALDFALLEAELGARPVVCGNLPYQLSSRIIVAAADQAAHLLRAVFMVQREVAERMVASAGSRAYGLLSVLVQRAFVARIVRSVRPGAFHPPPRVHSAVVRLEPILPTRALAADRRLVQAARAAFSSRRKTLRNSLSHGLAASRDAVEQAVRSAGIDPEARAETLEVADFVRLGEGLARAGCLE